MHSSLSHNALCKFGENVSNTLQDIALTMFQDAHMDACTHRQTGQKTICLRPHYIGWRHNQKVWRMFIYRLVVQQCLDCPWTDRQMDKHAAQWTLWLAVHCVCSWCQLYVWSPCGHQWLQGYAQPGVAQLNTNMSGNGQQGIAQLSTALCRWPWKLTCGHWQHKQAEMAPGYS